MIFFNCLLNLTSTEVLLCSVESATFKYPITTRDVFQRSNEASYGQLVVSAIDEERRRVCCYIFKTHFCVFSFSFIYFTAAFSL